MSFWKDKKVLVTGGAGFIGSFLCEELVREGAKVTIADRSESGHGRIAAIRDKVTLKAADLFDPEQCRALCTGQDFVMNLAAKVAGIEYNRFHHAEMFEENMRLQVNMLSAAADAKIKRLLFVSTASVYPVDVKVPIKESEAERVNPEPENEGYALAKLMGEKLARYYTGEKKLECVIPRLFNVYGPRDHYDEKTSHVIPALIKRVLDGDDPVLIYGSGKPTRSFIHVRDVARGFMALMEKAPAGIPINLGSEREVSIKELFEIICRAAGKNPKPNFDTSRPDGHARRAPDLALLKQHTGFNPAVTLEEGIKEILQEMMKSGKVRA